MKEYAHEPYQLPAIRPAHAAEWHLPAQPDGRTLAREAYFLDFARAMAAIAKMPVMTTGGIRRYAVAEEVLAGGVAVAGLATALAMNPALPRAWREGRDVTTTPLDIRWKDKGLASLATMTVVRLQLQRSGSGKALQPRTSPLLSLLCDQMRARRLTKRYRGWLAAGAVAAATR